MEGASDRFADGARAGTVGAAGLGMTSPPPTAAADGSLPMPSGAPDIRWGLCCLTRDEPIQFRSATHSYVARLVAAQGEEAGRRYLSEIVLHNARSLVAMFEFCGRVGIHLFRISSQLCPLMTHPVSGYHPRELPDGVEILETFALAKATADRLDIARSAHPDQFVVLNSTRPDVVESSLREMRAQAEVLALVGGDVLCLHGGGATGGKDEGLDRLVAGIERLDPLARSMVALENDDRTYAASDLLPVCLQTGVPLVLDAHHHRVLPGELTLEEATLWAVASWGDRVPYFHISSPREGWESRDPRPHHDYIDPDDIPAEWLALPALRVDVEAKAKESAVLHVAESTRAPFDVVVAEVMSDAAGLT